MLTLTRVISDCVSVTRTGNVTPDSVTSVSLARSYYGEPGRSPVDARGFIRNHENHES